LDPLSTQCKYILAKPLFHCRRILEQDETSECEWRLHKMVQRRCMGSIESGKDGDSWSRDGFEGVLLVNLRPVQGSWQSPAFRFEKAV